MEPKGDMPNRKKATVILTACICAVALLLTVLAVHAVIGPSAAEEPARETERIKADTRAETEATGPTTHPATEAGQVDEVDDGNIDVENNNIISSEKVKMIALEDAGLKESEVTLSRIRYEWDDGIQIYDVEFYCGGLEYEYEIDAKSGKILDKDIDD